MSGGGPRHGTIVDRRPSGGGLSGALGSYIVQDDEDERYYGFDYRQIVTEGFRTIRTGERVRFHVQRRKPRPGGVRHPPRPARPGRVLPVTIRFRRSRTSQGRARN